MESKSSKRSFAGHAGYSVADSSPSLRCFVSTVAVLFIPMLCQLLSVASALVLK